MNKKLSKPIILVGMMGCGKSAIGKLLAEKLNTDFSDSDLLIEQQQGESTSALFQQHGEAHFRGLEYHAIKQQLEMAPHIISVGGGAFIQDNTRQLIQSGAISIWIRASFDILYERLCRKTTRPLLEQGNKAEIIKQLLATRNPIYQQADFVVDTTTGPHDIVVERIAQLLTQDTHGHITG